MDRNSITGLILITLVLIGFWFINKPDAEQIEAMRRQRDSLYQVELAKQQEELARAAQIAAEAAQLDSISIEDDSLATDLRLQKIGQLWPYVEGEESFYNLENEKIKLVLTNKGARIYSVELKEYKTHDGKPLILFDE